MTASVDSMTILLIFFVLALLASIPGLKKKSLKWNECLCLYRGWDCTSLPKMAKWSLCVIERLIKILKMYCYRYIAFIDRKRNSHFITKHWKDHSYKIEKIAIVNYHVVYPNIFIFKSRLKKCFALKQIESQLLFTDGSFTLFGISASSSYFEEQQLQRWVKRDDRMKLFQDSLKVSLVE